jgi:hypothetical protein
MIGFSPVTDWDSAVGPGERIRQQRAVGITGHPELPRRKANRPRPGLGAAAGGGAGSRALAADARCACQPLLHVRGDTHSDGRYNRDRRSAP